MSTVDYLNLLKVYKNETEYAVWFEIDADIAVLDNCLQRTNSADSFRRFCCSLYEKEASRLGWKPKPGESVTVGMLRPLLLNSLGKFGDEKTIETARQYFRAFLDEKKDLEPDMRSMIFRLVGMHNGELGQKELISVLESSDFSEVQRQCLEAIGQSPDVSLQRKVLDYTFAQEKVRSQDSFLIMVGLASTVSGQETIWAYFKENMRTLVEKFHSPSSTLFGKLIENSVGYHCSEEKAKDVENFFKEHKDIMSAVHRLIHQKLEAIRLNADLLCRDKDSIESWLSKN